MRKAKNHISPKQMKMALDLIRTIGYRANSYDHCANIAHAVLSQDKNYAGFLPENYQLAGKPKKKSPLPRKRVWYAHIGHMNSEDDEVFRVMARDAKEAREVAYDRHARGFQTVERVWPAREITHQNKTLKKKAK